MPRIETPFKRVAVDIVGPLSPPTEEKHRYLLTLVDVATRYPEAVPLRNIDSVTVSEALFTIFARLGFPDEILTDRGTQFTSQMMQEFQRLLSIKGVHTSPYHAQSNGMVERFHGTLKPMLKKVMQQQPKLWHRFVPALLFACRESQNESTGFSPFELLMGRQPRGPMDLLARTWSDEDDSEEARTVCQYLVDLKTTIFDTLKIAHDRVDEARLRQKFYHDKKSRQRKFQIGDQVLVLSPTTANKLQLQWKGPFHVVEIVNADYRIDMGRSKKVYHFPTCSKHITTGRLLVSG